MHNLTLLLLDCLVVLMMIGPQSVSAQVLGAVYFRGSGSGSINPQAISPTRTLLEVILPIDVGETVAEHDGKVAGICIGVALFVVLAYWKYAPTCDSHQAAEATKEQSRIVTA